LLDVKNCAQAVATKNTHAKPKQIACPRKLLNLDPPAHLPLQKVTRLSLSSGNLLVSGEGNC